MSAADKLRDAGWRVIETSTVWRVLPPDANRFHGWCDVSLNHDGSPHLVPQRSDLHKRMVALLA